MLLLTIQKRASWTWQFDLFYLKPVILRYLTFESVVIVQLQTIVAIIAGLNSVLPRPHLLFLFTWTTFLFVSVLLHLCQQGRTRKIIQGPNAKSGDAYSREVDHIKCLGQICPTQMAYWAKNYVTILTRAANWKTYWGPHIEWLTLIRKANLV